MNAQSTVGKSVAQSNMVELTKPWQLKYEFTQIQGHTITIEADSEDEVKRTATILLKGGVDKADIYAYGQFRYTLTKK